MKYSNSVLGALLGALGDSLWCWTWGQVLAVALTSGPSLWRMHMPGCRSHEVSRLPSRGSGMCTCPVTRIPPLPGLALLATLLGKPLFFFWIELWVCVWCRQTCPGFPEPLVPIWSTLFSSDEGKEQRRLEAKRWLFQRWPLTYTSLWLWTHLKFSECVFPL